MLRKAGYALLAGVLMLVHGLNAQDKSPGRDTTIRFKVEGVCEMCKERIEKAYDRKGIQFAEWNPLDKMVTIRYNPAQITVEKLHQWAADVGHSTELRAARQTVYLNLPECCRYKDVDDHFEAVKQIVASAKAPAEQDPKSTNKPAADGTQTRMIRGVVMDTDRKGNFQPLAGASVHWLGTDKGVLSDSSGTFRIAAIEGNTRLVVSYAGYFADTFQVTEDDELKVIMAAGNQLKAVEVTGRQRSVLVNNYSTIRTQVMTERELFKAACCNLSESFETNPSVDVAYNDALTGSKQIQLLGLSGNYSTLTLENMPGPRGLATPLGLNYVPGPWVESIQLSKGVGSVVNGFESISGQINVEMKKPEKADPLYVNVYVNDMGKVDLNLDWAQKINAKWSTAVLLHDNFLRNGNVDFNNDRFRDVTTGNLFTVLNRWKYEDEKGVLFQAGFKYLTDGKTGGEVRTAPAAYKLDLSSDRMEGFMKLGYVFPGKKYKSIGWQFSAYDHSQRSVFGAPAIDAFSTYEGSQRNVYSNLIYQSILSTTDHKFRTGWSFSHDRYRELFRSTPFDRIENVVGAFLEYNYSYMDKFSLVAGMRADHNSIYGWFGTPRLHLRYEPVKGTVLRFSTGRGQRTANILAENMGVFVSSRIFRVIGTTPGKAYGLDPEVAWNTGVTLDQQFSFGNRKGSLALDYYYTNFTGQVVADMEDPRFISFYNLDGKSYSSSFQAELNVELARKLDLRLAWRFNDVRTTYDGVLLQRPLVARNRAFVNISWEKDRWKYDLTVSSIGMKRIPSTQANPKEYQMAETSPAYWVVNGQVSRYLGKKKLVEVYLGVENLTNYFQQQSILATQDPFGDYFDASLIWGPVYGRMFYSGIRWKIKKQ